LERNTTGSSIEIPFVERSSKKRERRLKVIGGEMEGAWTGIGEEGKQSPLKKEATQKAGFTVDIE